MLMKLTPDDVDMKLSKSLEKALELHGVFETKQELNYRMEVLERLNKLFKGWIKELSIQRNMPPSVAKTVGGRIYTFGSYHLGAHDKGADIDALCVAPRHIHREDYFSSFVDVLRRQLEITELHTVQNASVQLIKMNFDGIKINMTFARLELREVSESQSLSDSTLLKNLDQKCVLSLHGHRVPISPTFNAKLLCMQISKAQKDTDDLTKFYTFGICACKSFS